MAHTETWACLVCKDTPNFPTREEFAAHMRQQHEQENETYERWLN